MPYTPPTRADHARMQTRLMQDAKCLQVPLGYMAGHLSRFSLCQFLTTLFISDDAIIKKHTNMLLSSDGVMNLLDLW